MATTRVSVPNKAPWMSVESLEDGRYALKVYGITRFVSHDREECVSRGELLAKSQARPDPLVRDRMTGRAIGY